MVTIFVKWSPFAKMVTILQNGHHFPGNGRHLKGRQFRNGDHFLEMGTISDQMVWGLKKNGHQYGDHFP